MRANIPHWGAGHSTYLPWLTFILVTLLGTSVYAHGDGHRHGDDEVCVPWICSCFYEGVYYDEGDVWDSKEDACTKFQCVENGLFLPIKSGCLFKGECRETNTTWSEGCFSYRCSGPIAGVQSYQLIQAGCVWKDGNCYSVGQRVTEHCDIYECQIDGGCYAMNKIKSACRSSEKDAPCQPLLSFWQDECAIYQCVGEDYTNTVTRINTHSHDVMMWPRGHYALPAPLQHCANQGEPFWLEGSYTQVGDGCNYESKTLQLLGTYNETVYDHNYCVHHDVDDPTVIPLYQTYWEPGRYCILAYNQSCPDGFSSGYLEMYNNVSATLDYLHQHNFTNNTQLLDTLNVIERLYSIDITNGITSTNVNDTNSTDVADLLTSLNIPVLLESINRTETLYSIDADDGFSSNETIDLVDSFNITELLNSLNATERLNSTIDDIILDSNNTIEILISLNITNIPELLEALNIPCPIEALNITKGQLPDGKFSLNSTRMEFCCRYDGDIDRPIVLPAKHPFMLFMAENETDCQTVQSMNHEVEFWSFCDTCDGVYREMNGSLPLIKTGDNNTLVNLCFYKPMGCGCTADDESVVAVGDQLEKDCVTRECQSIQNYNIMVVMEGGCYDDFNEVCREENETWTDMTGQSCYDKQCVRVTDPEDEFNVTFKVVDLGKGCRDGDNCVPLNYTKVKGCYHTQCQKDPYSDDTSFVVTLAGCSDGKGHCIPDGEVIQQGCLKFKCDRGASKCGLKVVEGGCSFNNTCYGVGEVLDYRCSMYECKEYKTATKMSWKLEPIKKACADSHGNCYDIGAVVNTTCATYKCIAGQQIGFSLFWAGCRNGDQCVDPGETVTDDCSTFVCTSFEGSFPKKVSQETRCSWNDTCYEVGDIVEDKEKCVHLECCDDGNMRLNKTMCGFNGQCVEANETTVYKCATYKCQVTDTKRYMKKIEQACKAGDRCIPPGKEFTYNCHKFKCSDDHLSCKSELIEYGCREPNTTNCLDPGDTLPGNCGAVECQPNGTANPFVDKSGCSVRVGSEEHCVLPEAKMVHRCSEYVCRRDEQGQKALVKEKISCAWKDECYEVGDIYNDTENCVDYICTDKDEMAIASIECGYKNKCYPANSNFSDGCNTFECKVEGNKRSIKHIQIACKAGDKCIPPGKTFTYGCNRYKCSEDAMSCKSELIGKGCKDPQTGECLSLGDKVTQGCNDYICQLNGTDNRLMFHSAACSYQDQCFGPGEKIDVNDCDSIGCAFKENDVPSSGLVLHNLKGCMVENECLQHTDEHTVTDQHDHYCFIFKCLYGKLYKTEIACKSSDNTCVNPEKGESKAYTLSHSGKLCAATCSRDESNQVSIKITSCQ